MKTALTEFYLVHLRDLFYHREARSLTNDETGVAGNTGSSSLSPPQPPVSRPLFLHPAVGQSGRARLAIAQSS